MHILFLFIGLKAVSSKRNVVCSETLTDLLMYTRSFYELGKEYESEIKHCFSKLFNNINDAELLNRMVSLLRSHERMLLVQKTRPMLGTARNGTINICIVYLRLWVDELKLFLKNVYVTKNISFEKELKKALNNLRRYGWLDGNVSDSEYIPFFAGPLVSNQKMEEYISYLFSLIIDGNKNLSNYISDQMYKHNDNDECDRRNYNTNNQAENYCLNNDNQPSIFNSENIELLNHNRNELVLINVEQDNNLLADIDYLEDGYHANNSSSQIANNAGKPNNDNVNENKIDHNKSANESLKNGTNAQNKETRSTKDSSHIKKDNSGLNIWPKLLIYVLIALVVIMAIELYWPEGKKLSENATNNNVLSN